MRADPAEYRRLDLRAHTLLADAPLHDVWTVDLPGGGPGRTVLDVRALLAERHLAKYRAARWLFGLRRVLGRVFGWDRAPAGASERSYAHRLSDVERAGSLVAPGTPDGPFRALFVSPRESIGEVHNATVHGFPVLALVEIEGGYRLYLAVHVRPVGRITSWYMALIEPFRRWIVYPSLLRAVREGWTCRLQ